MKNKDNPQDYKAKMKTSICGLLCEACSMYIASTEDPDRLKMHSQQFQLSEKSLKCYGCRSKTRAKFCGDCKMRKCASKKGLDFCSDCDNYPCKDLVSFQAECPHRNEIWQDQERRKKVGTTQWVQEAIENYSCPSCNTINSPFDLTCRNCGTKPASSYISKHQAVITEYLNR